MRLDDLVTALPQATLSQPLPQGQATITATAPLTNEASVQVSEFVTRENYIPLFVAIAHEGDGFPNTLLRNGVTAVPSSMAIGATWNEKNAQAVGEIVGRELSALGFNLLMM